MPIKFYKPNRAARKGASISDRSGLHSGKDYKSLTLPSVGVCGRGAAGTITIRHRGGGVKRNLRMVDFGQDKLNVPAKVERLEYDPNRAAHLALLLFADGERRYVLAWHGARPGDLVVRGEQIAEKPGNRMQLKSMTPGLTVYNVELKPGRGGVLLRSAGTYATLMDVQDKHALLKLPSGEVRLVAKECFATVGTVSNPDHWLQRVGSAGRKRRKGWRPAVRGKAMNPVDHPHGGGEGNQPIGLKHPKTLWGKPALGVKTRAVGKYSDAFIVSRRVKKTRKK
jgi:large subunit ribosomal protein L2